MHSPEVKTIKKENGVRKITIKEKEEHPANRLPAVFLRYGNRLLREAAFPTALLALCKAFGLWEHYVTNFALLQPLPALLSSFLPSSMASMSVVGRLYEAMSSEVFLFVFYSMLVHEAVFFAQLLFYSALSSFHLLARYRIVPAPSVPAPSPTLIRRSLLELPFTHFLLQPLLYFTFFPFFQYFGTQTFSAIPSLAHCFYQYLCMSIITDFFHYSLHRFAHLPAFFPYHRKRHQYKRTMPICTDHCSFLEHITLSLIPLIISPMLLGVHSAVWLGWLALRTYEAVEAHSGYDLPYLGFSSSRPRDYHHAHTLCNYGMSDFWDSIFHTNLPYLHSPSAPVY